MNNDGREFEKLTGSIYQNLIQNPQFEKVEKNVQIQGKDGKRQIDILVTTVTFGIEVKTIIECKDYNRKVSVGTIDGLHSLIQDVNAHKGIIVSSIGFSSMAISKAKRLGITLCTAHEALNPKWNIPVEIPFLLTRLIPINVSPNIQFICEEDSSLNAIKRNNYFNSKFFKIFKKYWESNILDIHVIAGTHIIDLNAYLEENDFWDDIGRIGTITDFKVELNIKLDYYFGYLNEVQHTRLLKEVTRNISIIQVEKETFFKYLNGLKKINLADIPNVNKQCLDVYVKEEFNFGGIKDLNIKDVTPT